MEKIHLFNASIVDVIIGKVQWNPEDLEGQTHSKMMAYFSDVTEESEALTNSNGSDRYRIVMKNRVQFFLAIDFLAAGLSLRQVSIALYYTKGRSGQASIGMCSDFTTSRHAWYACAVNLQKESELIEKSWRFSGSLDMSRHMNTSDLDVHIRLHHVKLGIINLRVLVAPVYERHTEEVIFDTASRALGVLRPSWRDIIIGLSTDDEKMMTGRIYGVETRFQKLPSPDLFAVGVVHINLTLSSRICTVNLPRRHSTHGSPHWSHIFGESRILSLTCGLEHRKCRVRLGSRWKTSGSG